MRSVSNVDTSKLLLRLLSVCGLALSICIGTPNDAFADKLKIITQGPGGQGKTHNFVITPNNHLQYNLPGPYNPTLGQVSYNGSSTGGTLTLDLDIGIPFVGSLTGTTEVSLDTSGETSTGEWSSTATETLADGTVTTSEAGGVLENGSADASGMFVATNIEGTLVLLVYERDLEEADLQKK